MFNDMKDVCLGGVNLQDSLDPIETSLLSWKKGPESHLKIIMKSWGHGLRISKWMQGIL